MQARVNAGIRKKNPSGAFILEINSIGFKRHNSLLKTVYASTVRIINLILCYLFKGWQLRKGNQWLELSKRFFLKNFSKWGCGLCTETVLFQRNFWIKHRLPWLHMPVANWSWLRFQISQPWQDLWVKVRNDHCSKPKNQWETNKMLYLGSWSYLVAEQFFKHANFLLL